MPELQAMIDDVREQLDYHRRVDVYIVQKANPSAQMTSYLGTKVIVLEGMLIADLLADQRPQLTYLLARFFGALKARHERMTIVFVILEAVQSAKFLFPFIDPYYRATAYSGDQMGQACCGDLDASLSATERLMVGREIEPELRARGVIQQAHLVRRRILPRLVQLALPEPHLTNRYLNLLLWSRRAAPDAWNAFSAAADPDTNRELTQLWERSPHRRPLPSRTHQVATSAVAALLTGLVLIGVGIASRQATADDSTYAYGNPVAEPTGSPEPPAPTPEATSTPIPTATATPESDPPSAGPSVAQLIAHVPSEFRDSCKEISAGAAVAAVDCTPLDEDAPATARYLQFDDETTMNEAFDAYAVELPARDCPRRQVSWEGNGSSGRVACYEDDIGSNYVVWTDEQLDILGYAQTILVSAGRLFRWWRVESGPV
jgi:hypothetical protein